MKACDRLEWDFLQETLDKVCFIPKFIDWIMTCVCTVTYPTIINGEPKGWIQPERGLRQGDPLSPNLFILCAEVLNNMMKRAKRNGEIKRISISNRTPPISHLLFSDYSLFFCQANEKSSQAIRNVLQQYERAFGQKVNTSKSVITFGKRVHGLQKNPYQADAPNS